MSDTSNMISFLEAGIKAESLRQKAIASNVANLRTPGYRRVDINFRDTLADAMESGKKVDVKNFQPEVYQPLNTPVKEDGNDVSLDYEVGQMVKNSLVHKTYTRLLNKIYSQMELASNTSR